jgi:hypothetical protein
MFEILKTLPLHKILFIQFSYTKFPHTLCLAYHKLNGVHHCFIIKVLKVLNRFFHDYAINVILTT